MLFGADLASHQGDVDMIRLQAIGHSFVIDKATGENNYFNPYYFANNARKIAAKVVPGSYDWYEPQDPREGEWLAEDYLRSIGERGTGHLLGVDFETEEWATGPLGTNIEEKTRRYIMRLLDISGQGLEFYTGPYFMQQTGAINWGWLNHPRIRLWLAAPGPGMMADDSYWPQVDIRPFTVVGIHQHQWFARDRAIGTGVNYDRDRFNGTLAELVANGYQGHISQAEVISGAFGKGTIKQEVSIVQEPPAGKYTAYINAQGEAIFVWNAGGQTKHIDGINVQDLGLSVESATEPGVMVDISIQNNTAQPWRERK
jgi:hypothetical protein